MKKKKLFSLLVMSLIIGFTSTSCDSGEDLEPITGEALFSYVANGMEMTFTNLSSISGVVTYAWDFGDGGTSIDENPVYTYSTKGEYNVTLTVSDEQGGMHPVVTKVNANKATRIDLTDGSFADWDVVTEAEYIVNTGAESGIVTSAKVDYDGEMVYMYLEFEGTVEYGFVFDVYLNTDNDATTGSVGWIWPASGGNYLIEGQFSIPTTTDFTNFIFAGETQDAWAWSDTKPFTTGYATQGNIANIGTHGAIEIGFDRSKAGLENEEIEIGVFLSDPVSWASVGFAPDASAAGETTATCHYLDMR